MTYLPAMLLGLAATVPILVLLHRWSKLPRRRPVALIQALGVIVASVLIVLIGGVFVETEGAPSGVVVVPFIVVASMLAFALNRMVNPASRP